MSYYTAEMLFTLLPFVAWMVLFQVIAVILLDIGEILLEDRVKK